MKILIVGGEGTIGRNLKAALSDRHDVITAGRSSGTVRLDITSDDSITRAYEAVGEIDACVCVAAHGAMDRFSTLTAAELRENARGKLFGQLSLVLIGQHFLRAGGCFVVTSGIFGDIPYRGVTGGALISGALHSFVLSAALELPRGLRINAVSPSMLEESADAYGHLFPGMKAVPMERVVASFVAALETPITGQILRVYWP